MVHCPVSLFNLPEVITIHDAKDLYLNPGVALPAVCCPQVISPFQTSVSPQGLISIKGFRICLCCPRFCWDASTSTMRRLSGGLGTFQPPLPTRPRQSSPSHICSSHWVSRRVHLVKEVSLVTQKQLWKPLRPLPLSSSDILWRRLIFRDYSQLV